MGADYSCMLQSDMGNSSDMHGNQMECAMNADGVHLCNENDPNKPCFCCKSQTNDDGNCPHNYCTEKMGWDYTCVKNSQVSSTMECEFNNPGYCNDVNSDTSDPCVCCKEMPGCPGDAARSSRTYLIIISRASL